MKRKFSHIVLFLFLSTGTLLSKSAFAEIVISGMELNDMSDASKAVAEEIEVYTFFHQTSKSKTKKHVRHQGQIQFEKTTAKVNLTIQPNLQTNPRKKIYILHEVYRL